MQTSFDTPRVVTTNPFASYGQTSFYDDDPWSSNGDSSRTDGNAAGRSFSAADSFASTSARRLDSPSGSTSSSIVSGNGGLAQSGNSSHSWSNIIDEATLPPVYSQTWEAVSDPAASNEWPARVNGNGSSFTNSISISTLHNLLSGAAGLPASTIEKIINIASNGPTAAADAGTPTSILGVTLPFNLANINLGFGNGNHTGPPSTAPLSNSTRISKQEFYAALALAALAQSSQVPSVALLMNQRDALPSPNLDMSCLTLSRNEYIPLPSPGVSGFASLSTRRRTKLSSGSSGNDPWRSANGHAYGISEGHPSSAAYGANDENAQDAHDGSYSSGNLGLPGFTTSSDLAKGRDVIAVIQQEDLAGSFLSRHTVYRVESSRRGASVMRRYSDWLWLHEALAQKYPARLVLNLPPKRMGISARHVHIANDEQVLDRRRRGLARYTNFVANHHILCKDNLVGVFLTEPGDLSTWRKSHSTDVLVDESSTSSTSRIQEQAIPNSLETTIVAMRDSLPLVIDAQTRFCALLERILHRQQAIAADLIRARMGLDSFTEVYSSLARGAGGRNPEVEEETTLIVRDLGVLGHGLSMLADTEERHCAASIDTTLEELKSQREMWRAFAGLLERYDSKLRHDNVDKLRKRIGTTQRAYSNVMENRKTGYEEEGKRLLNAIAKDEADVKACLDRRTFLRYALTQELRWVWRESTTLRVILGKWSTEGSEHAKRIAQIWQSLENSLA